MFSYPQEEEPKYSGILGPIAINDLYEVFPRPTKFNESDSNILNYVFVAHNWKGAELALFRTEFQRPGINPKFTALCTMKLANRLINLKSKNYFTYCVH